MAPLFNQNFLTWSNPSINRGGGNWTYEDDFSSDNWVDSGSNPAVSGGVMNWSIPSGATLNSRSTHDLTTVSDTLWLLRCKITTANLTDNTDGTPHRMYMGISDSLANPNQTQDFIGLLLDIQLTTSNDYASHNVDGTTLVSNNGIDFTHALAEETVFDETKRTSATTYTIELFSDSNYSSSIEQKNDTCASTTDSLRYLSIQCNSNDSSPNGVLDGTMDDLFFNNGVTTPP